MSSVYVVCWIFLQTFQTYFCIQANSVDPDQTAPKDQSDLGQTAPKDQSDLGPHCLQKWLLKSQADDKADANYKIGALRVNIAALWLLSMLGKQFSRRHSEIFFLFFPEKRIWHFMQIVSWLIFPRK